MKRAPAIEARLAHALADIAEAIDLAGPDAEPSASLRVARSLVESALATARGQPVNARPPRFSGSRARGLQPGVLRGIDAYLLRCLERESPPRVSELARVLGLAPGTFVETFHSHVGMKPSDYLKQFQTDAAAILLRKTNLPVGKVGYAAGFGTRRTFFREFRQRMGTSPEQYRNRAKCL